MLKQTNLEEVFTALDRQIGLRGGERIALVICGGTALAALGLMTRTTKDADVLGRAEVTPEGLKVVALSAFPEWLEEASEAVARDFGLPQGWLNLGPAPQVATGLPPGLALRLTRREYGPSLSLYFISRLDQIHFKLYAAVDRDDYHVQDLLDLHPGEEELAQAVRWVTSQDVSEPFRMSLKALLERMGYGPLAASL